MVRTGRLPALVLASPAIAAVTAQGLRMAVNLLVVKMIAVFIGPSGMGVLGHFMSLTTMVSVFAGGGIGNGITKYVAEYRGKPVRSLRFIGAAAAYGLIFSLLIFCASVVFRTAISTALFGDQSYAWLLPVLGVAQLFCFVGTAVIAIANGQQKSALFAVISIVGYVGSLPFVYLLITCFGIQGAALALMLVISCTGIPALWIVARSPVTRLMSFRIRVSDARKLGRFSVMLIISASVFPMTEIAIRNHLIQLLGSEAAGLWQAMTRLSGAYLGFFSVFLATNFMPRLSGLLDVDAVVGEVRTMLVRIGLAFVVFACVLYFLQDLVIKLLFSDAFSGMSALFGWQLVGDFCRVLAYVIGFLGVAKAAVGLYIGAEVLQAGLYGTLTYLVLNHGGSLQQVAQVYALTYFVYLCITIAGLVLYQRGGR
jgi:O-antigen/teichoic acid export membrane protein